MALIFLSSGGGREAVAPFSKEKTCATLPLHSLYTSPTCVHMLKSVIIEHMAQMAETRSFLLLLFRPGNEAKWNIVMQARWACHVCLVNLIECFKWQCESRVLKVVGDVIVQASWACDVVCTLVPLTKEVSTSVKLEISQDTNCGW